MSNDTIDKKQDKPLPDSKQPEKQPQASKREDKKNTEPSGATRQPDKSTTDKKTAGSVKTAKEPEQKPVKTPKSSAPIKKSTSEKKPAKDIKADKKPANVPNKTAKPSKPADKPAASGQQGKKAPATKNPLDNKVTGLAIPESAPRGVKPKSSRSFNKSAKRTLKKLVKVSRKTSFMLLAVLPWTLAAIYYLFFAADFYVSSASFMIREAGSQPANAGAGITLAALTGFASSSDEHILHDHILSLDMMRHLDAQLDMKAHFSESPVADGFSKLSDGATQEDFFDYYQSLLTISYNELSGLLTVNIKSYNPEYSRQLLQAILDRSEAIVNDKSRELAQAQLSFVQNEIQASADRLVKARKALINFQDANKLFNPEHQGQTVSGIISQLESELATKQAEQRRLLGYQRKDSPNVITLGGAINSLKAQIEHENTRLVKSENNQEKTLNQIYGQYKELELEVEVAQTTYLSALTSLESARIEASRQLKYLLVINAPFKAEEALYPRKIYNLITLAIILLLVFGIFRMVVTTIREHLD